MTSPGWSFRLLALCASAQASEADASMQRAAIEQVPSWDVLLSDAEWHGMELMLSARIGELGVGIPPDAQRRFKCRWIQHAHAAAVRGRVMSDALGALERAGIGVLVLKGAALAQLVYVDPRRRPMRDVDILVRPSDADRAWRTLQSLGFSASGHRVDAGYHHLQPLSLEVDGEAVTVEVHRALLRATPFVAPLRYDDLIARAQAFEWHGLRCLTLGCEDMLWHVYAHAFVVNALCPGIRLVSIADLAGATETWVDRLDWADLRRRYPRLVRALSLVGGLTPWSPSVAARVRSRRASAPVQPVSSSTDWRGALSRDVWWPPGWWFDMRYGVDGLWRGAWHRLVTHPATTALVAAETGLRRIQHS